MFDDDYERALLAFSSASHDASDAHDDGAGPAVDTARQRLPQSPGRTPGKANVHTFLDVIKRGGEAQGQGCQGEGQDAADTEALSPMRQLFLDELTSLDGNLSDSSEEPLPPLPPPSNDTYEAVMTTITTPSFNPLQPFTVPLTRDHGPVGYGFSVVMEVSSPGMIKNMIVHKVNDAGPAARAGVISGDLIVLINDTPTAKLRHDTAISLLDTQGSALRLAFIRPLPDANAHHAPIIINTPPASDEGALSDTCSTASSVPRYAESLPDMSHAVSPYSDFVLTGPRKTVKTKAKIKKRGGFTRRTPRQRDDDTMSTTSEHTTPTPTPKRSSGKKTKAKELGRRFLQLDKVELPSKKGKGNGNETRTWKHFLGLDAMPTVLQQILHPKVNNKQAVKKRAAACKSKAHKLQKLITNKKAKGQETDLLENTLTKTHSDYIKNDLQDQFNTMDISAMMGETHAVLLNRHPDHGIGMRVVSCTGIPYLRVSEIVLNGSAHTSGLIRLGDRVLRINGKDMHGVAPKIALRELKHDETVALVLGRDASPLDPAKAEAPLVVRCSRIPMPMRPPLLTQLSKLEAEVQGRELVLGYINDGVESDVIRNEYERLGRHVKLLRSMLAEHDKTQVLQQEQRSEIELMREQMREVNRHAAERAAKEQAADIAIIKMLQTKLETLEHEKLKDGGLISELEQQSRMLAQALVQKEDDLTDALSQNCNLAAALRQRGRVRTNEV